MEDRFSLFFAFWAVLGVASRFYFAFNRDAGLKRRLWPWFAGLASALLLASLIWIGFPLPAPFMLLVFGPVVLLATVLNARGYPMVFCDGCGASLYSRTWWKRLPQCPACGRRLER